MNVVHLYLLVVICVATEARSLKSPEHLRIRINDIPPSFDVSFPDVQSDVDQEPIIGYKVKVLQVQKIKRIIHKVDNDTNEVKTVEVEEYPKINPYKVPAGNYTELIAPAVNNPKVTFYGAMPNVAYEITAYAFTKNQEGPTSSPIRFRIHDSK